MGLIKLPIVLQMLSILLNWTKSITQAISFVIKVVDSIWIYINMLVLFILTYPFLLLQVLFLSYNNLLLIWTRIYEFWIIYLNFEVIS